MPIPKYLGDRPAVTGDLQVASLPATKAARPPIDTDRYFRNAQVPDASAFNAINEAANQAMVFRTAEKASFLGVLGNAAGIAVPSGGTGDRARWRFAFHTSPYHNLLLVRAVMYPQGSGFAFDAYNRLDIRSGNLGSDSVIATQQFHYGPNPTGTATAGGWQMLRIIDKYVEGLSPDTDYYGTFVDVDNGRIQSVCVAELNSATERNAGYLPQNFTEQTNLLDEYRANLVELIKPLINRSAWKVLTWSRDNGTSPQAIAVNTDTNIIDTAITSVSASSPGFTLDMTGKRRLSQTAGCPCVMKAYGNMGSGAGSMGIVKLKNSAGSTVASISGAWGTAASWQSVAFNLPASVDKYDLQFQAGHSGGGETFNLFAVSIYQYAT